MFKIYLFQIQKCGKYTVNLGNIEMDKMMNTIKIPIPPIENQKIIVEVFNKIAPNKDLAEFMKFYNNSTEIMNTILDAGECNANELEDYLRPIYNYYMQIKNAIDNYEMAKYSVYIRYMIFNEDTEIKRLGDLFELEKGKPLGKVDLKEGKIRVIGGGFTDLGTHNISNLEGTNITIAKGGESLGYTQYITEPIYITTHCCKVIIKENININTKYLYYYLKYNYKKYNKMRYGVGTPYLNEDIFLKQYIYTPTLEIQKQIVENIEKGLKFQEDYYNNIKDFI
jgi:restriction endonuclease S subunit